MKKIKDENMILNEKELVMLMIMAYGGMTPRGIQAILPIGVNNALKWKNWIGIERFAKKIEKKFKSQKFWWGNEEFDELIMSIALNEREISFKKCDTYLQSFFQSSYGYSILEFKGNGIYEARVSKSKEEWAKELKGYIREFFRYKVNDSRESDSKNGLEKASAKMYIKKFVDNKNSLFEILLTRQGEKIIYKKSMKRFLISPKVITENEISINDVDEFIKLEIE